MNWFSNLLANLFPAPSGLKVDEPDPLVLRLPPSPVRFFDALPALIGSETILYWEGGANRTLAAWLARHTLEPRPVVSAGIMPLSDFYHVPLTAETLAELAVRVAKPEAIRGRVHLHVREGERTVLEWRPAFGPAPLLLSRRLPLAQVYAFSKAADAVPVGPRAAATRRPQ